MSTIVNTLREKVKEAENQLAQLHTLIAIAKEAGLDTTLYETRVKELEGRLTRWKNALKKAEESL